MDYLPKRAVKILLKRYLNPYLRDEISVDQIETAFPSLILRDLIFDPQKINAKLGNEFPFVCVSLFVQQFELKVPLYDLWRDHPKISLSHVALVLAPNPRKKEETEFSEGEFRVCNNKNSFGAAPDPNDLASSFFLFEDFNNASLFDQNDLEDIFDEEDLPQPKASQAAVNPKKMMIQLLDRLIRSVEMDILQLVVRIESPDPTNDQENNVLLLRLKQVSFGDTSGSMKSPSSSTSVSSASTMSPQNSTVVGFNPDVNVERKTIKIAGIKVQTTKSQRRPARPLTASASSDGDLSIIDDPNMPCIFMAPFLSDLSSSSGIQSKEKEGIVIHMTRIQRPDSKPEIETLVSIGGIYLALSPSQLQSLLDVAQSMKKPKSPPPPPTDKAPLDTKLKQEKPDRHARHDLHHSRHEKHGSSDSKFGHPVPEPVESILEPTPKPLTPEDREWIANLKRQQASTPIQDPDDGFFSAEEDSQFFSDNEQDMLDADDDNDPKLPQDKDADDNGYSSPIIEEWVDADDGFEPEKLIPAVPLKSSDPAVPASPIKPKTRNMFASIGLNVAKVAVTLLADKDGYADSNSLPRPELLAGDYISLQLMDLEVFLELANVHTYLNFDVGSLKVIEGVRRPPDVANLGLDESVIIDEHPKAGNHAENVILSIERPGMADSDDSDPASSALFAMALTVVHWHSNQNSKDVIRSPENSKVRLEFAQSQANITQSVNLRLADVKLKTDLYLPGRVQALVSRFAVIAQKSPLLNPPLPAQPPPKTFAAFDQPLRAHPEDDAHVRESFSELRVSLASLRVKLNVPEIGNQDPRFPKLRPEALVLILQRPSFQSQSVVGSREGEPSKYLIRMEQLTGFLYRGHPHPKPPISGKLLEIHFSSSEDGLPDAIEVTLRPQVARSRNVGLPDFRRSQSLGDASNIGQDPPPRIVNYYARREQMLGPFSPKIAMFEGQEKPPRTLDQAGMHQFQHDAIEYSKTFIHMTLPFTTLELSRDDYVALMAVVDSISSFMAAQPAQPPMDPHVVAKNAEDAVSTFALQLQLGEGQILLRDNPKDANERHSYEIEFADIELFQVSNHKGTGKSYLTISVDELMFAERTMEREHAMRDTRFKVATKLPLFQTESPFWKPSIKITIATYLHEPSRTTYRTQLIEVQGVQLEHTKRSSWMKGLSELFQRDSLVPPSEDKSEDQLFVVVEDCAIRYSSSAPVLSDTVLNVSGVEVKIFTSNPVKPDAASAVQVIASGVELFVIDDRGCIKHNPSFQNAASLKSFWMSQGFQSVAVLDFLQVVTKSNPTRVPATRIDVFNNELRIDATSDALRTMVEVIKDLTSSSPPPLPPLPAPELEVEDFEDQIADHAHKRLIDDDEGFIDDSFEHGGPYDEEEAADELVVLRLEPEPRMSLGAERKESVVNWLVDEQRIPIIANYLDNIPPRSDISDVPKEMSDVSMALLIHDMRLRWRLRPGSVWNDDGGDAASDSQEVVEVVIDGASVKLLKDKDDQSRLTVTIRELVVFDRLATSNWDKLLCYNNVFPRRRKNMITVLYDNLKNLKNVPGLEKNYQNIRTVVIPLKVNLTHSAFSFLREYFVVAFMTKGPEAFYPPPPPPVSNDPPPVPAFFERIELGSINVMIDYKPPPIETLTSNNITELINIIHLEGAFIELTGVRMNKVKGFGALGDNLKQIWLPQVWRSLPGAFGSIRGINYISSIGSAIADLVLVPWTDYKRGGKAALLPSILRAGKSTLQKTATQAINLMARTTTTVASVAEKGQHIVDPAMGTPTSKYANQPDNVAEGLQQGLETVTRQLREARDSIFVMPLAEFEKNGFQSAVKQVARAVPIAVLKPVIGTTAGLSKVLLGVRNQIDKTEKVISEDKYRGANTSPGTSPGN